MTIVALGAILLGANYALGYYLGFGWYPALLALCVEGLVLMLVNYFIFVVLFGYYSNKDAKAKSADLAAHKKST